ncbi:MAG: hypothetical protein KY393_04625, partial [Actinobacteria bacterium]|nr:hypothetical protein [Actinomycetota bacterium]
RSRRLLRPRAQLKLDFPGMWQARLAGYNVVPQTIGMSGAEVYRLTADGRDPLLLKTEPVSPFSEVPGEAARLMWLRSQRIPCPTVVGTAERAGRLGLPMALAIIGGIPERFASFAEIHRRAAREAGHPPPALSINSHGYIAETAREAIDDSFPYVADTMNRIGRERGWQPMTKADYEASAELTGANFVGTPQQVIDKILFQYDIFGHQRFLVQFSVGTMPHDKIMRSIELYATQVAPVVRKEVARRKAAAAAS